MGEHYDVVGEAGYIVVVGDDVAAVLVQVGVGTWNYDYLARIANVLRRPNGCDGDQSASGGRVGVVAVTVETDVVDDVVAVAVVVVIGDGRYEDVADSHWHCCCYSNHPGMTLMILRSCS